MIKFVASFKHGKALRFDTHDGEMEVVLLVPGTDAASVLRLAAVMKGKPFTVIALEKGEDDRALVKGEK